MSHKNNYYVVLAGHIVDSAFTVAFNPMFDPLLAASRDATYTGIKVLILFLLLLVGFFCSWIW